MRQSCPAKASKMPKSQNLVNEGKLVQDYCQEDFNEYWQKLTTSRSLFLSDAEK